MSESLTGRHTDKELLTMVAVLRHHGARVRLPMDLLEAGPWGATENDRRRLERQWLGTTTWAAMVAPVRGTRVSRGCCCACKEAIQHCGCQTGWSWKVKAYGGRHGYCRSGVCDEQEDAQGDADDALIEMLQNARKKRIAALEAAPYEPRDTISVRDEG